MKKDIRVRFQKDRVKKTADSVRSQAITPTDSCRNAQKTSLRRRPPPKIEASCFCFLRSGDSDEISLRPPPYNPGYTF